MDIDWIGDTGVVRLDHGVNAFETVFVDELHAALDVVEANESARALVTVGADKHYSNGFDIDFLGSLDGDGLATFMARSLGVLARLLTFPVPTAAALNGHAFGIGAMLALAHDRRVSRADRGWFCLPEIDLGMQFHPFMLALIRHRLPAATVEEAVLSGRRYDGAAAVTAGIAHRTAAPDDLVDAASAQVEPLTGKARAIAVALKRDLHAPVLAHLEG
jgi:enoyl-CoA hydratase/carnithine racemase